MAWLRWFGSGTFTVPNGVTKLKITAVGGSGAGGSALATGSISGTARQKIGGGGGGAGQVITTEVAVSGGQVLVLDIGRGALASTQNELQTQVTQAINQTLAVTGFKSGDGTNTIVKVGLTELVKAIGGKSGYNDANGIDRGRYSAGRGGAGGGQADRPTRETWQTSDSDSNLFRGQDGKTVFPSYTTLNNDGINQFTFDNPNKYYTFGDAGDAGGFLVTSSSTGEVVRRHPKARFRLTRAGQAGDGATAVVPTGNSIDFQQGMNGGNGVVTIEWTETSQCVNPNNITDELGVYSSNSVIRTSRGLFATSDLLISTNVSRISSIDSWYKELLGRPADKAGARYWSQRVLAVGLVNAKIEFISAAQDEINSIGKTVHVFTMCQAQCIYTVLPGKYLSDDYADRYLENMVLVDSNGIARLDTLVLTPNYNGPKDNNFGETLISWYREVLNRLPDAAGYRFWLDYFKPLTSKIDLAKAKEIFVNTARAELEKNGRTVATYSYAESLCLNLTFTRSAVPTGSSTTTTTTTTTNPPSVYNFCYDLNCQLVQSLKVPNFIAQTRCETSSGELRYAGYNGGSGQYEVAFHEQANTWFTTEAAARNPSSVGGIWRLVNCKNPDNTFDNLAEYNIGRVLIYEDNFVEQNVILVATTKTADAALVNAWYQSELGRPADQVGLNFWVAAVASARLNNSGPPAILINFKNQIKVTTLDVHGKVTVVMSFCQYQNLTNPLINIGKNGLKNGIYFLAIRDFKNKSLVTVKSVTLSCIGTATEFLPAIRPPITLVNFTGISPNNAYVYTRQVRSKEYLLDKYNDLQKGKFQGWERLLLTNNNTAPLLPFDETNLPIQRGVPYYVAVHDASNLFGDITIKRIQLTCQSDLTFDIKITSDIDVACAYIVASNFRGGSGQYEIPSENLGYFLTREEAEYNTIWRPINLAYNIGQTIRIRPNAVGQCFYYAIRDKLTQEVAVRPIQCGTVNLCNDLNFEVDTFCSQTNCNTFRMLNFTGGSRRYEVPFGTTKFFKTRSEAESYNVFVETFEDSYNISGLDAKPGFCYYFVLRDAVTKQRIIKAYSCGATSAPNGCLNPSNFELWPQTTSTTTQSLPTPAKASALNQLLVFEPRFVVVDQYMFVVDDITSKTFIDTDIPFKLKVSGTPPFNKFTISGITPDGPFLYNETTNITGDHVTPFNIIKANGIAYLTLKLYESIYSVPPTTSTTTLRTFVPQAAPSKAYVNQLFNLTLTNGPTTAYSTAPVSYTRASSPGPISRMYAPGETLNGTFNLDSSGTGTVPMTFTRAGQAVITFSFVLGTNYYITKNPLVHVIDVIESTIAFTVTSKCNSVYGREIFVSNMSGSIGNRYNVYLPFDTDETTVMAGTNYVVVGPKDVITSSVTAKGTYYVKVTDSSDSNNAKVLSIAVTCDPINFTITVDCPNINISKMTGDTKFRVYVPSMTEVFDLNKYVIAGPNDIVQFILNNGTHYILVSTQDGISTATKQVTVNCDPRIPSSQLTSSTTTTTTISPCDNSVMVASNGGINFTICPNCNNSLVTVLTEGLPSLSTIDFVLESEFNPLDSPIPGAVIKIKSRVGAGGGLYRTYIPPAKDIRTVENNFAHFVETGGDDIVVVDSLNINDVYYVKVADAANTDNFRIKTILINFSQYRGIYTVTNFSGATNYEINYTRSLTRTQSEDGPFSNPTISLTVTGLGNTTYYVTLRDRDNPSRYATKSILISCDTGVPTPASTSTCPLYMAFCSFESFGTINVESRDQFIDTGFGTFE